VIRGAAANATWAPPVARARASYLALVLATIAVGLLVHLRGAALGAVARDVLGDALWAAMIAWWAGALAPRARLTARGAAAFAVCVVVEASQLFHAPALDAVRATRAGHLVLGSGFDRRDFVAYAAGVAGAMLLEVTVVARWLGRVSGGSRQGR
jgi:Protein of unknown function (DUF2809)